MYDLPIPRKSIEGHCASNDDERSCISKLRRLRSEDLKDIIRRGICTHHIVPSRRMGNCSRKKSRQKISSSNIEDCMVNDGINIQKIFNRRAPGNRRTNTYGPKH